MINEFFVFSLIAANQYNLGKLLTAATWLSEKTLLQIQI